jgi:predicted GTPase
MGRASECRIYAIRDGSGAPILVWADVRVTAMTTKIISSSDREAWGFKTFLSHYVRYARSPSEAWAGYADQLRDTIREHTAQIARCRALIPLAEASAKASVLDAPTADTLEIAPPMTPAEPREE